jgi:hypothetical protein
MRGWIGSSLNTGFKPGSCLGKGRFLSIFQDETDRNVDPHVHRDSHPPARFELPIPNGIEGGSVEEAVSAGFADPHLSNVPIGMDLGRQENQALVTFRAGKLGIIRLDIFTIFRNGNRGRFPFTVGG